MMKFRIKTNTVALAAICWSLGTLFPTESSASLWSIACNGIYRDCIRKCGTWGGGGESCYERCEDDRSYCLIENTPAKQQTSPPPCYGAGCPLRNRHPPTTVGQPTPKPPLGKPTQVNPVSVSNPNQTNTGNSGPVLLYRQNSTGGGHGKGH
jgi:hypothetical protein